MWHVVIPAVFVAASLAVASMVHSDLVQLLAVAAAAIGIWVVIGTFFALPAVFLKGPAMAGGIALINTIGNLLGGFAGQYVIGVLREQTGSYAVGFVIMGAALLLSSVIVLAIGRSVRPRWIAADVKVSGA